jgi:hypothetical protein
MYHTKQINTICGQNSEMLIVKADGTYSYHLTLKGYTEISSGYVRTDCKRNVLANEVLRQTNE